MATRVNPPPQIVLPEAFKNDPMVANYFEERDRVLLQLWQRTGGASDAVNEANTNFNINLVSQITQLRREIDGLPDFTIDTTGFTFDSTELTFDKVIA